jgi:hypothetical protein
VQLHKLVHRAICVLTHTFIGLLLFASIASATTYSYSGAAYTSAPLAANLPPTAIGPGGLNLVTSWSFFDGVATFTQTNSGLTFNTPSSFVVSTDTSGNVSTATIGFTSPIGPHTVGQTVSFLTIASSVNVDRDVSCALLVGTYCAAGLGVSANAAESTRPGIWSLAGANSVAHQVPLFDLFDGLLMSVAPALLGMRCFRSRSRANGKRV